MGTGASIQGGDGSGGADSQKPIEVPGRPYTFHRASKSASIRPNNLSGFGSVVFFTSKSHIGFVDTGAGPSKLKARSVRSDGKVFQTKVSECVFEFFFE